MRSSSILLLLLSGLGSAFSIDRIPLPPGVSTRSSTLAVVRPGLLVLGTSEMTYQTADRGAHWDTIPNPSGSGSEAVEAALISSSSNQVWNGTAWINASFPPVLGTQPLSWTYGEIGQPFDAAGAELSNGDFLVMRSYDSMRSWSTWFRVGAGTAPAGIDMIDADFRDGRVWAHQNDSARWLATTDGIAWTAASYPSRSALTGLETASGDTLVASFRVSADSALQLARSLDGGRHWTTYPLDQAGISEWTFQPGVWLSTSGRSDASHWVLSLSAAPSPSGPWTLLTSAGFSDFVQDDALYFVDSTGLYRADLSGLATIKPGVHPAIGFELRRSGDRTMAILDGIRPIRWTLSEADGSILGSGVATGSFEVPPLRGGAFLAIEGMGAKRLPPF